MQAAIAIFQTGGFALWKEKGFGRGRCLSYSRGDGGVFLLFLTVGWKKCMRVASGCGGPGLLGFDIREGATFFFIWDTADIDLLPVVIWVIPGR